MHSHAICMPQQGMREWAYLKQVASSVCASLSHYSLSAQSSRSSSLFSYWSSFPNSCNAPRESSGYERRTVATMVVSLELTGRLITQRCVQIMLIVVNDPAAECPHQFQGAGPFLQPEALLFERTDDPRRVRVPLRIVIAGNRLVNAQGCTHLHQGQ